MQTLHRLCTTARTALFTSIPALMQRVLPAMVFSDAILQFQPNGDLEREALVSSACALGYRKVPWWRFRAVQYSRGDRRYLFDGLPGPATGGFLGDTIESLRFFDPATQKSTDKVKQAWVLRPAN